MYNFFKNCLQFCIFIIGILEIAKATLQKAFTGELGFCIFVISIVWLLIKWDQRSKKNESYFDQNISNLLLSNFIFIAAFFSGFSKFYKNKIEYYELLFLVVTIIWFIFRYLKYEQESIIRDAEKAKIEDIKKKEKIALEDIKQKERERFEKQRLLEKEREKKEHEEWKEANPNLVHLYVLKNNMAKGHVKIGFTNGNSIPPVVRVNTNREAAC
jgi:Ca2+/Na+ antiporter